MFDRADTLHWPDVVRPLSTAGMALGRLAHALEASPLHATWLWREITRSAVAIAHASGYHAKVDHLRLALIGAPLEREDNTSGLAAAKRVFLASAPLFRSRQYADSMEMPWPRFWDGDAPRGGAEAEDGENPGVSDHDRAGEGGTERGQLMKLVRELGAFADDGQRPALINLFTDLKKHAATRSLSPPLVRVAVPLALTEAGLVPKAAPGLLGGRRLALGFNRAVASEKPLTDWLAVALEALAKEAGQSHRRLVELERQHQAWHAALDGMGLRRHAKAPKALDLLAATPVLTIGLVARHLACSHVAAGKVIERLVGLGIVIEQTARSRHKVYIAGDLPAEVRDEAELGGRLAVSAPLRPVDVDALTSTLDSVFADLDRQSEQAKARLAEAKG